MCYLPIHHGPGCRNFTIRWNVILKLYQPIQYRKILQVLFILSLLFLRNNTYPQSKNHVHLLHILSCSQLHIIIRRNNSSNCPPRSRPNSRVGHDIRKDPDKIASISWVAPSTLRLPSCIKSCHRQSSEPRYMQPVYFPSPQQPFARQLNCCSSSPARRL